MQLHELQDAQDHAVFNCDEAMEAIFGCTRMPLANVPSKLNTGGHLMAVRSPDGVSCCCSVRSSAGEDHSHTRLWKQMDPIEIVFTVRPGEACGPEVYETRIDVEDGIVAQLAALITATHEPTCSPPELGKLQERISVRDAFPSLKLPRAFAICFLQPPVH